MNQNENSPQSITTFQELVTAISEEERTKYVEILNSISIPIEEYDKYESWSEGGYTRNCIVENEAFELILICWAPGQSTPVHDHGGEECWVYIANGEVEEKMFEMTLDGKLNETKSSNRKKGNITYMVDMMGYHSLANITDKRACTLHLYAKPIESCNIFDSETKAFVNKDMTYDTVANLNAIKQ